MITYTINEIVKKAVAHAHKQTLELKLGFYQTQEVYNKKFAELIIEECCEVVINSDPSVKMVLGEPYRTILSNIEKHFELK